MRITDFFITVWSFPKLLFQQSKDDKFKKTLALLQQHVLNDGGSGEIMDAVRIIEEILKQNPALATKEMVDQLKPMLKDGSNEDGSYGVSKIIGVMVKENPALATKETLDLFEPVLKVKNDSTSVGRCAAMDTIGIIIKQNPALATKEMLDLFKPVLNDGRFNEIIDAARIIEEILKQNPSLANQETLNKFKSIIENGSSKDAIHGAMKVIDIIFKQSSIINKPNTASVDVQKEEVQKAGVDSEVFDGQH